MRIDGVSGVGCLALALLVAAFLASAGEAGAQSRRRSQEAAPPALPLPAISEAGARCSNAYHTDLDKLRSGRSSSLASFESSARIVDPEMPGKWMFWLKGGKKPASEQVCVEQAMRAGRQRCVRWDNRKLDAAIVGVAPSSEDLAVLRALDAFVTDRGAPLEFGSNGRQFVALQRFAIDMTSYLEQAPHPALCNGAIEMLDFLAAKIAGVQKRADDVAATAAKALALARQRVVWSRDQRMAESRAAVAAVAAADASRTGDGTAQPAGVTAMPAPPPPLTLAPVPADAPLERLVLLAVEGLLPVDKLQLVESETDALKRLSKVRELISEQDLPGSTALARGAAGAALRMIEAAVYGRRQVARVAEFRELFVGTVDKISAAHRQDCTCGP